MGKAFSLLRKQLKLQSLSIRLSFPRIGLTFNLSARALIVMFIVRWISQRLFCPQTEVYHIPWFCVAMCINFRLVACFRSRMLGIVRASSTSFGLERERRHYGERKSTTRLLTTATRPILFVIVCVSVFSYKPCRRHSPFLFLFLARPMSSSALVSVTNVTYWSNFSATQRQAKFASANENHRENHC